MLTKTSGQNETREMIPRNWARVGMCGFFFIRIIKKKSQGEKKCHAKTMMHRKAKKMKANHVPLRHSADGIEPGNVPLPLHCVLAFSILCV